MSNLVGQPIARVESRDKVTGATRYTADIHVPGLVHGFLVMSTVANGRLTGIDTAAARTAPGVIEVLTHETMPRLRLPDAHGRYLKTFIPMQDDLIRHNGQPIALVVAETLEQAEYAATLVKATYSSRTPQVSLAEAMSEAFIPPPLGDGPNEIVRGDPQAGLREADVVLESEFTTPMHHHNPIEPSATTAVWEGDQLTVYETTQGITNSHTALYQMLGVRAEQVRVVSKYLGGGFGSKAPVWPHTILTAAAARVVRRPVKLVLSRAQTYTSNGHRAEGHQLVVMGAKRDGRLTVLRHVTTQQITRSDVVMFSSAEPTRMAYAVPNMHMVQRGVRLDLPTQSFMRSPEVMTTHGLECAFDELAYRLNLDPIQVRLANYADSDPETGRPLPGKHLRECYRRAASTFGWARRDPKPGSIRDRDGFIGWGMATAGHTAGGRPGGGARITIGVDGRALVQSGTQDIGTGTYTVMTQVAADGLGMRLDTVRFELGDTNFPVAYTSGASNTVPAVTSGVNRACVAAVRAVAAIAVADRQSPLFGTAVERIKADDGFLFVSDDPRRRDSYRAVLSRHGQPVQVAVAPVDTPLGFSTGAVFVEVHVDPRIGRVRVRRVVTCYDVGRVLNLRTVRSQAIGGAVWAIGFTLSEHTFVDPHYGRVVNPNFSGYLMAVNADVPDVQVEFIDRPDPDHSLSLGARGFGESPMTGVTAAIANAVYHATGRRIRDLPITQDKLL